MTQGFFKGEITLYFSQISGIQFKKAGLLAGFITFTVPGELKSKWGFKNSQKDENSVLFQSNRNAAAREFKNKVETAFECYHHPKRPAMDDYSGSIVKTKILRQDNGPKIAI